MSSRCRHNMVNFGPLVAEIVFVHMFQRETSDICLSGHPTTSVRALKQNSDGTYLLVDLKCVLWGAKFNCGLVCIVVKRRSAVDDRDVHLLYSKTIVTLMITAPCFPAAVVAYFHSHFSLLDTAILLYVYIK